MVLRVLFTAYGGTKETVNTVQVVLVLGHLYQVRITKVLDSTTVVLSSTVVMVHYLIAVPDRFDSLHMMYRYMEDGGTKFL